VSALTRSGCRAVPCDTVAGGFDLDPDHLALLIDADTLCVIATHYGGALTDVPRLREAVRACSSEVAVIEDAAQAFGAFWNGAPVGTHGDIGIYSFGVGKGFTISKGGALVALDEDVRAGLRATARRLAQPSAGAEAQKVVELAFYHLLYNPAALTLAYGAPRRFWLGRNEPERAIGDEPRHAIGIHPIGPFRRRVGMRSLPRLAGHLADARRRRLHLASLLDARGSHAKPYLGPGEPSGTFLFAMTESAAALDALLARLWGSRLGVTKLFMSAIGSYASLAGQIEPSQTPNAERLAATTLTITTSGFMTDGDMAAITAVLVDDGRRSLADHRDAIGDSGPG
jgi:perosamine synthetase